METPDPARYRVTPGRNVDLGTIPTTEDGERDKRAARSLLKNIRRQIEDLQERLYAQATQSLLIVFQAMDTGGKDSTIREVLGPLNPQGVRVWNFRKPSLKELSHDYLWRVHRRTPGDGYIGVFNRSHYEDVLVVRVKNIVPPDVWQKRFDHINAFEQRLVDEGTAIIKFYLHISPEFQKQRLQKRLENPDKHWKFNPDDLKERARWNDYMRAYEDALAKCSTEAAPWYIIPAEARWWRDVIVASIVHDTLKRMNPQFPVRTFDPATITLD